MNLEGSYRRKSQKVVVCDNLLDRYPFDVQMYSIPPDYSVELTEFEELAVQRLKLLRILEQASQKGRKLYSDDWLQSVVSDLKRENLNHFHRLIVHCGNSEAESNLQARKADHISHFILRLVYCRSEELRRWFLSRELDFFKLRIMKLSEKDLDKFLSFNNISFTQISQEEKHLLRDDLYSSTSNLYDVDSTDFYKVPFSEVSFLIRNRKVLVKSGFAYITKKELVFSVSTIFRAKLSQTLAYMNQRILYLDDDRVDHLLTTLHTTYTGRNFEARESTEAIDPSQLDSIAKNHFPLCMRSIHENFRATHTLKHGSRLQYGFFCKAIGLLYEDCLQFWKEEFTKIMDERQFEKQYAYAIKHNYGKAGRMVNYSPHSCLKIIMGNVGAGDTHGCPFKLWDHSYLKQKLTEYGFSRQGIEDIVHLSKAGHYQLACGKYFECVHGRPSKELIIHPNQYYQDSIASKKEKVIHNQPQPKKLKT